MAVSLVPGIGVVAVLAAQQATAEEGDEAQAGTVDRAADFVRMHVPDEIVLLRDFLDVGRMHGEVVTLDLALLRPRAIDLKFIAAAGAGRGHGCIPSDGHGESAKKPHAGSVMPLPPVNRGRCG